MLLRFLVLIFLLAAWPVSAQDMARVKQTVTDLASPEMHGRGYVKDGDKKAAEYIRSRFEALKIQPLGADYFQKFSLGVNTITDDPELKAGSEKLQPGTGFVARSTSGKGEGKARTVYFDTLVFRNESAGRQFLQQPLRKKAVVIRQADYDKLVTLPDEFKKHIQQAKALVILQKRLLTTVGRRQDPMPVLEVLETAWPANTKKVKFEVEADFKPDYQTQNVTGFIKG
ncbi:MAG TPA: hypothetical protein VK927_11345, partial [Adhaeribacter sp.]|nr:hypothetical protein [Adhaeribacter sp.]